MDQNPPEILKVQPEAFLPERGRERIWRHIPFSILFGSILLTNISYNALKDPQNFQPPAALAQASIEKPEEKKLKFEEIIFKNFSTGHEKKAKRVLDLEKTAIKPILDLDVPPEDHQFWSEFMSAIAYIEFGNKD